MTDRVEFISIARMHNGEWVHCAFEEIRAGDRFRKIEDPNVVYTALDRAHPVIDDPGRWVIRLEVHAVEPHKPT